VSTYRLRRERLDWREIEGEILALDSQTSTYLSANPAAALLWDELTSGSTREALARLLAERYGLDLEQAQADVDRFLDQLRHAGLLEEITE
jgi:hypothetical protein